MILTRKLLLDDEIHTCFILLRKKNATYKFSNFLTIGNKNKVDFFLLFVQK